MIVVVATLVTVIVDLGTVAVTVIVWPEPVTVVIVVYVVVEEVTKPVIPSATDVMPITPNDTTSTIRVRIIRFMY